MDYTPPHWGTKKGQIINAIAIDWCFKFWDVQRTTNIESSELYDLIGELMFENVIYVYEGQYRVNKELYHEYWDYAVNFTDLPEKIYKESMEIEGKQVDINAENDIIDWINTWAEFQKSYGKEIIVNNNHFYLDGSLLSDFIYDLVRRANSKITYVSPWVEEIGVTKNLMLASTHGKNVTVITRAPDWSSKSDWYNRQSGIYEKCHSNLSKSGASIIYNNEIHGKVLLVDDTIAVVSSFNLLKNPASGLSWEAGIITYDQNIVSSINESIKIMTT